MTSRRKCMFVPDKGDPFKQLVDASVTFRLADLEDRAFGLKRATVFVRCKDAAGAACYHQWDGKMLPDRLCKCGAQ